MNFITKTEQKLFLKDSSNDYIFFIRNVKLDAFQKSLVFHKIFWIITYTIDVRFHSIPHFKSKDSIQHRVMEQDIFIFITLFTVFSYHHQGMSLHGKNGH